MRENYVGKCYYCKQDVFHEKMHDYGAFTKKIDKKTKQVILSDVWHMDCYVREMKKAQNAMQGIYPRDEYIQLSLFDKGYV